jgi:hypothetical protein
VSALLFLVDRKDGSLIAYVVMPKKATAIGELNFILREYE